ncbi:MAG: ferrous iron transport protein B [Ardenticatenaceae bacterium]|nr:ferrous iron transport protein B [Ardenticatenaceae bacterium]
MTCPYTPATTVDYARPILLIGNPNVGKSALFSQFTGHHVDISNYPGTTVESIQGQLMLDNMPMALIDTPGVQSLMPRSDDERVTRDMLLTQHPWAVIQVADAKNLRRALLLTFQLAEYEIPFVLALNMSDEAKALGIEVDARRLMQILGAAVVPTVATQGGGLEDLRSCLLAPRPVGYQIHYDGMIETAVTRITHLLPQNWKGRRAIALAFLSGDTAPAHHAQATTPLPLAEWQALVAKLEAVVAETAVAYDQSLGYIITQQRLRCADCLLAQIWQPPADRPPTFTEKLDNLMLHPLWGWLVLALVLLIMYLFVGQLGAGIMVDWLESTFFGEWINPLAVKAAQLIPIPLVQEFLVGDYGLVTMALSYSIAIVFPIVFTFFLAFSFLEDSGYLARLTVMANRPFKLMGLNGKAVLPMVLGLGCDTMATLTTRILETRKERLQVTLLLALGVPCSAQLGVLLGMTAFLTGRGVVVWLGTVLLVLFVVGWLASRLLPGKSSDFILELPPIRKPQLSNIAVKTVARVEWYLKEVLPLFILGTTLLFVLDKIGLLALLERWFTPFVEGFLGLPGSTAGIFLIGFLRRDFGAAGLFTLARDGLLTTNQLVISLVVITLFIPCIANILIIIREHGRRTAVAVAAFVFPFAFLVGGFLNFLFNWLNIQF